MIGKGYVGANYAILYQLLTSSEEKQIIMEKKLKEDDEQQYTEFVEWKENLFKIWEEEGKNILPWK